LRARFLELAPDGFEELEREGTVALAAYGESARRVLEAFPDAETTEVADDWADRWREFHRPVRIGPLWVGPPWIDPPEDALAVVIDPGQAFGTGAHPTSQLCLELLLEQAAGSVLDVGCGSGVLAIAAARLGFSPVVAVDHDEVAVRVTTENAAANGVDLRARVQDARAETLPGADLAIANVSLEVVEALGAHVRSARLITAGYLTSGRPVLDGFDHIERRELDGWAADLFLRNAQPPASLGTPRL
jgi:ribosomal protein L11 methyltransferase